MVPPEINDCIAICIDEEVGNAEKVTPKISREKEAVPVIDLVIQFGIQVVEIGPVVNVKKRGE